MINQAEAEKNRDRRFAGRIIHAGSGEDGHSFRFYPAGEETRPVYIDIHGGGMCWGAMENADLLARMMNEQLGIHVLAPDYPLVPEAEYPEQIEYIYGTILEIVRRAEEYRIDPDRMIIGGRSAGGNLAAAITMLSARRQEFRFIGQILDHPWLDLCGKISWEQRGGDQRILSETTMKTLALGYAPPEKQAEMTCTPLNAPHEVLSALPPAVIQTCGLDPMRPEGAAYAEMLKKAGVPVLEHCFPDVPHGFSEEDDENGQAGRQWIVDAVRRMGWA